jgi:hypothetical protein
MYYVSQKYPVEMSSSLSTLKKLILSISWLVSLSRGRGPKEKPKEGMSASNDMMMMMINQHLFSHASSAYGE